MLGALDEKARERHARGKKFERERSDRYRLLRPTPPPRVAGLRAGPFGVIAAR